MEEKKNLPEKDQSVGKKKIYTPPTLTVYGKLTNLTGGGTKSTGEGTPGSKPTDKS